MEQDENSDFSGFVPKQGNPINETVYYKIGGTVYEVTTSCGGSEALQEKVLRLMKTENLHTPNDKELQERYNIHNTLFVGRSLQEE